MDVQFNEPEFVTNHPAIEKPKGLTAWVIKSGYAKNEAGVTRLFLIVIATAVAVSVVLLVLSRGAHIAPVPL